MQIRVNIKITIRVNTTLFVSGLVDSPVNLSLT